ncbi:sugar ABC transporter substrate-binding protein [Mesorhizobium sp. M0047]|uniref:sugar ABC transporter substrate-binding protein n=1 Tax=Mesorhizobium sp. M0047 TaxID=2956859 RepID=UPI00333B1EEB
MLKNLMRKLALGLGVLSLSGSTSFAGDLANVYVGVGSASSEYWAAFIEGAKAVAGSKGKDVNVIVSDFNGQKLLEQFGAVFATGCEGCAIAVDPASNAFTKAIIERAGDAGAKIVNLWNRPDEIHPWDTAPDAWVANISFDGVDSGYRNGMELCKALKGTGNIAALEGIPDNPPAKQRLSGLKKAVAECPGMKLVDVQVGNWDQTQGQDITRAWLTKYGKNLNGIFAENDGMALGAVAALREQGLAGKIPVTGSDGSSDAMHLIKTGEMLSTMYIDGFVQGATATALAVGAITGDIDLSRLGNEQRDFYLSQTLVNKDNVEAILTKKNDPAAYSYDKVKANFWAASVGQIPAGANK